MSRRIKKYGVALALASVFATGCAQTQPRTNFQNADMAYYRDVATQIETPDVESCTLDEVTFASRPFSLKEFENLDNENFFEELTLERAVQTALANSKVVRTLNYGVGPNEGGAQVAGASDFILRTPDGMATVYDPALQETSTGGGFGGIGVEAALAAFDAQLTSSVTWNRNERPVNTGGIGEAIFATNFNQDLGTYSTQLAKQTAAGTSFFARHNVNYELNNNPTRGVPSDWGTNVEVGFNQPLLQGWGTQFNRIAGPNSSAGFYRGVAIARINNDITLADFEIAVRDQVKSVEDAYWELYMAYRAFDSAKKGRDNVLATWQTNKVNFESGGVQNVTIIEVSSSKAEYFRFRAAMESALNQLFRAENRIRYLMGLAATDGRLFRPADEPTTAEMAIDWNQDQIEMLARTAELRRQRWRVKQRELELTASKNFLLPRLDAQGTYRFLGAGDTLIDPNGRGVFPYPGSNAFSTLTDGDYQEWQLGLNFSMSLGFRQELAGVRNAQLQLARARAQLQEQELGASHLLAEAFRNLESNFTLTETRFNAWIAALEEQEYTKILVETQAPTGPLGQGGNRSYNQNDLLRAIANSAIAETNYYRALVNYNRSIVDYEYRKGSLLEYNHVYLAEGPWPHKAYADAMQRAMLRSNAVPIDYTITKPGVYSRGPYPQVLGEGLLAPLPNDLLELEEVPTPAEAIPVPDPATPDTAPNGIPQDNAAPMSDGSTGPLADLKLDIPADDGQVQPAAATSHKAQQSEGEDLLFRPASRQSKVEPASGTLNISSQPSNETGQQQQSNTGQGAANSSPAQAG